MPVTNSPEFGHFVHSVYMQHLGERVYRFEYQGRFFWLKQPERLKGIWHVLKPDAKSAFQQEIQSLLHLKKLGAPVPQLATYTDDYFVLEDVGKTVNLWIEDPNISKAQIDRILADSVHALVSLHRQNLVHGRPALRDIAWNNGIVKFIDLENLSKRDDLNWHKVRDSLVFIHGLFRSKTLDQEQAARAADLYAEQCEPLIWRQSVQFIRRFFCLSYLLRPLKSVAGIDLLAVIRVFDYMQPYIKGTK